MTRRQRDSSSGRPASIIALGGLLLMCLVDAPVLPSSERPVTAGQQNGKQRKASAGGAPAAVKPAARMADADDLDPSATEMRGLIERFMADRGAVNRTYPVSGSTARQARLKHFYSEWCDRLAKLDFDAMDVESRADFLLFENHIRYETQQLEIQARQFAEGELLLPFAKTIVELEEGRRRMEPVNSAAAAATLNGMKGQIEETHKRVEAGLRGESQPGDQGGEKVEPLRANKTVAYRAVATIRNLRGNLKDWFAFYYGYDPEFTWWVDQPYKEADQTLAGYAAFLSEKLVGVKIEEEPAAASSASRDDDDDGRPRGGRRGGRAGAQAKPGDASDIVGDPIGRDALAVELANEMIPYTPEELIAIGEKELAWCEAEMRKASRELGYGDDWHKALEHVKTLYVEPGKQPQLIRDLEHEAEKFLDGRDLLTIPPLARETWRMEMMSPERQLINPFFTGGETIRVSYPTHTMPHEQKMMSMRGNNPHFSRATVHHELIAGHHLQQFMTARYKPYRRLFSTPFWGEGWALYWELLLWDLGFVNSPEDRIGMLFWRMHRGARIIFSLSFHLQKMTPQECIDFLVERVGHERENATAEVRRSFESAPPLYQAAYLLGGLQIRELHRELVGGSKITNREFHDTVLRENRMPIEMLRAIMTGQKLPRNFKSSWKFYGEKPGS